MRASDVQSTLDLWREEAKNAESAIEMYRAQHAKAVFNVERLERQLETLNNNNGTGQN